MLRSALPHSVSTMPTASSTTTRDQEALTSRSDFFAARTGSTGWSLGLFRQRAGATTKAPHAADVLSAVSPNVETTSTPG